MQKNSSDFELNRNLIKRIGGSLKAQMIKSN